MITETQTLQQISVKAELTAIISSLKKDQKSIGLVLTMGALHEGHLSLVERAKRENDVVITTIFVNPTQFNNSEDLKNYPVTITEDIALLEKVNCDIVFMPSTQEMYPNSTSEKQNIDLNGLDKHMEGTYRKGHFEGVYNVVNRFFKLIPCDNAYFGEKDYQQLALVKHLNKVENHGINIVGCPVVREANGLAMSSRNKRLSADQKASASFIHETLQKAVSLKDTRTVKELRDMVHHEFANKKVFQLDYFEIIDSDTLTIISKWEEAKYQTGCIATYINGVRLIDIIHFN